MITKIKDFLQTKKFYFLLTVLIVTLILYINKDNTSNKSKIAAPTIEPKNVTDFVQPKRKTNSIVYQLNMFETESKILDYGWNGNKINYITVNGFFDLWKNSKILTIKPEYAYFNDNGLFLYNTGKNFYLYKINDNTTTELGENLFDAEINKNGTHTVYQTGGIINIKNLANNTVVTKNIPNIKDVKFGFIKDIDAVFIYNITTEMVSIFNYDFVMQKETQLPDKSFFLGINGNADQIVFKSNNYLHFASFDKKISTTGFNDKSDITASWIDNNRVVVVESRRRELLEVYDNYIWIINTNGEKTYITNSFPVKNGFNTEIQPKINQEKNAIILSENGENLWIISLIPSKLPFYEESGINFLNINSTYEDSH